MGPLAGAFRRAYLPPDREPAAAPPAERDRPQIEWIVPEPSDVESLTYIWVRPGAELRQAPDEASPVLQRETSIRNLWVLNRRGDWYQVRLPRPGQAPGKAWVLLPDYQEPSVAELNRPEPVLPLPASPPAPAKVAAARELMADGGRQERCGDHPLFTDVTDEELLRLCPRLTRSLEEVYRRRYGLQPVGPAAEAIILFRSSDGYRTFRDLQAVPFDSNLAHAVPAAGYVALFQGERSTREIAGSLVHELTHLLNRRSLGPALPPWLGEGLADDLAESRVDDSGELQPGRLGGEIRRSGSEIVREGALAAAILLQEALDADRLPSLETLVRMDRQAFYGGGRGPLHYALSSFWIRYLLSGFRAELQTGFRQYLRAVAAGETLSADLLWHHLGSPADEIEPTFHVWLRLQFLTPTNETRAELP